VRVVDELPEIVQVLPTGIDYGTTNPFAAVMLALTGQGERPLVRRAADKGLPPGANDPSLRI
jgi:hypothetical protein